MWPEEGSINNLPRSGFYIVVVVKIWQFNGCGQNRVIQRMWREEGNLSDMARRGRND